ncbi:MAG: acetyl-CoA carboxylase carboxyl transferase subunit alpha, partial [Thalassotalea sp.]|nr:acetyl-CoA carboxylase carboxyl transferase subunit alpha [Thalassotalea sp.]
EGCASILWKTAEKASTAAEAMGVTAPRIKELGLIDNIIDEPLGGAHRDFDLMANTLKQSLKADLAKLEGKEAQALIEERYQRLMTYGYC